MSHRLEKINELLKQEISKIIQNHFGLDLGVIVITAVITSPDLQLAKVYVKSLDDKQEIINKLQKQSYNFQKILIKKITSKFVPKLSFYQDDSQENISNIEKLLDRINKENK